MHDVPSTFPVGSLIRGRYVVVDLLGQNASGAVYLVRDKRNQMHLFVLKEVIYAARKARNEVPTVEQFWEALWQVMYATQ